MQNIIIKDGLPINIIALGGFYIVLELDGEKAVLYSISDGSLINYPIDDIAFALNASAQSMQQISLTVVKENIGSILTQENEKINELREELLKKEKRVEVLEKVALMCENYYADKGLLCINLLTVLIQPVFFVMGNLKFIL